MRVLPRLLLLAFQNRTVSIEYLTVLHAANRFPPLVFVPKIEHQSNQTRNALSPELLTLLDRLPKNSSGSPVVPSFALLQLQVRLRRVIALQSSLFLRPG